MFFFYFKVCALPLYNASGDGELSTYSRPIYKNMVNIGTDNYINTQHRSPYATLIMARKNASLWTNVRILLPFLGAMNRRESSVQKPALLIVQLFTL